MLRLIALLPLVAVALLAGCGGTDDEVDAASLTGAPWTLVAGLDVPGWEEVAPSATFEQGRLGGSTGCNRYGAAYELDGASISLGEIASTRIACEGTAQAVEEAYLAALADVARWQVADDQLTLADADGEELLRFAVPTLSGSWTVTALLTADAVISPLARTELTARFDDGELSGNAGCNGYGAGYRAERGTIEIEQPISTQMACLRPAGVMEQEQAYLAALPLAASYRIEGETLTLLTAEGTIVATYERAR